MGKNHPDGTSTEGMEDAFSDGEQLGLVTVWQD